MPPTQSEELPLPLTAEGAAGCDDALLPLSPLDAMMHKLGVMLLYMFPSSTSGYDLNKMQTSFITLVNEDYFILIGELHIDRQTGVVSVKQTAEARQKGAHGIRFETNLSSSLTTEEAMKTLSWELMPTPRASTELICIKGTLLSDGGLVIGLDTSHTLLDGEGTFTFMKAWGQHYSDVPKQERLVSNYDRFLLKGTGEPSKLAHPEFQVVNVHPTVAGNVEAPVPPCTAQHRFHFTPCMMQRIKHVATRGESKSTSDPTYRVKDVKVTTAVNARSRLNPPMPENYAGNVIFSALSSYQAQELKASDDVVSQDTLVNLAQRVRGSIRHSDSEYLRDAINFLTERSNLSKVQPATNFVFGPDIMYTSWVRTGMYEAEFEGMRPSLVSLPPLPFDGFVILSEPFRNSPGVDVLVFLESSAMEKLKESFARVPFLFQESDEPLRFTL
ncbi:Transferase family [Phytophthora infestans]|uniref:Transferase family n=1 Tax=Phytophthora infestans TaxID=4787 RepID=A0A833T320_PHYIN|nr:Transferase family [Phytophthora infestans]